MWSQVLTSAVVVGLTPWLVRALARQTARESPARRGPSDFTMAMSRGSRVLMWLGFLVFSGGAVAFVVTIATFTRVTVELLGIASLFAVPGLLCLNWQRWTVVVSDKGITANSPWRRRRFIGWGQIQDATFQWWLQQICLRSRDGQITKFPAALTGLALLEDTMRQHLDPAAFSAAFDGYRRYLQNPSNYRLERP
jgi:hypothetical protein